MLRTDRPNIAPVNDPIGAVVWGMDTSNVDWVFVGGTVAGRARRAHRRCGAGTGLGGGGPAHVTGSSRPARRRRSASDMTTNTCPPAVLTRFVVASRYMPVYIALILLVVVASIWVPETLSSVALVSDRPVCRTAGDHRTRPDVGDHDGRHRSQHAGHVDAVGDDHGRRRRAVRQPDLDRDPHGGRRRRPHRFGERNPDRRAQAQRPDRHPRHGPDRGRNRQPLCAHVPGAESGAGRVCPTGRRAGSSASARSSGSAWPSPCSSSSLFGTPRWDVASRSSAPTRCRPM